MPPQLAEFERSLQLLRDVDRGRPLFVPWDSTVSQSIAVVEQDWVQFRDRLADAPPAVAAALGTDAAAFAAHIDGLVAGIEAHLSR